MWEKRHQTTKSAINIVFGHFWLEWRDTFGLCTLSPPPFYKAGNKQWGSLINNNYICSKYRGWNGVYYYCILSCNICI